jgi:cytochrome c
MDSLEFNKITAAVLIALILGITATIISESLISPKYLEKNILVIEGVGAETPAAGAQSEAAKLEEITPLLATASAENGEKIAKRCLQCHGFEKGGAHKLGPNLWGIVGAKHAHAADYPYSKALKEKPGQWDFESLNHFLYKPKEYVPGTKMSFAGLSKAQERADLIAYLNNQSDSPQSFPKK